MSDPAQLAAGEERDRVPELPHSPVIGAYANAAGHNLHHSSDERPERPGRKCSRQRSGSHSSVDVDFFDPNGVHRLGRTLSRMSQPAEDVRSRATDSSGDTAVDFDSFDLEKVMRQFMRKCVPFCFFIYRLC